MASSTLSLERSLEHKSFSPFQSATREGPDSRTVSGTDSPETVVYPDDIQLLGSMKARCVEYYASVSEAEEVVQDVFLTIYVRSGGYDADPGLGSNMDRTACAIQGIGET